MENEGDEGEDGCALNAAETGNRSSKVSFIPPGKGENETSSSFFYPVMSINLEFYQTGHSI